MPRLRLTIATAAVASAAIATAATAQQPLTLVYDEQQHVQQLVNPASGPGLSPARGALRQDPGAGGMLTGGDENPFKVAKVSGRALAGMSAPQIAAALKAQIVQGEYGATSHLVTVDEIGKTFGDEKPRLIVRNAALPSVSPSSPGARFSAAMKMLDTPSPYGGTWASRVHVYLAPAVHSSIAAGRGTHRNLGRDGKPHFQSWRGVMPGLALAGGVHLQMYHGAGSNRFAFTAQEWRTVPAAFTGLIGRYGGSAGRVHFLFSDVGRPAGAPGSCGDPVACEWTLAESTPAGRTVLANGPGVYRIGPEAGAWLVEYNKRFPG